MKKPIELTAAHRLGFGFRAEDLAYIQKIGYKNYLQEQLNPDDSKEHKTLVDKLATLKIPVAYEHQGKKIQRSQSLTYLNASAQTLWKLKFANLTASKNL